MSVSEKVLVYAFEDKAFVRENDYKALLQRCKDAEENLWFFRTFSVVLNNKNIKSIAFEIERNSEEHFRKYPEPL